MGRNNRTNKSIDAQGAESTDWTSSLITAPFTESTVASTDDLDAVAAGASPTSHTHTLANITDAGSMDSKNIGVSGTLLSGDASPKVITVTDGIITSIF